MNEDEQNIRTFDECMESVGMHHRYQKYVLLIFFPYWVIASFFVFQQLYTFKEPIYRCYDQSLTQQQCSTLVCSPGYPFDENINVVPENTFTYQFGLFCGQQYIRIIYKLMPKVLPIIGYYIYGILGDKKGRVVSYKISWRFFIIGCFFFALTKTQVLITMGYVLASINCMPTLALQFPLLFQQSNKKFWGIGSMAIVAWQGFGQFILSLVAMPIINSSSSSLLILCLCTIPSLICGFFLSYFIESPKYFYGIDKLKALKILNKIAAKNHRQRLIIDLKKSYWVQVYYKFKPLSYAFMMYYSFLRLRLFVGFILFFAARSAMSSSQIMLDKYLRVSFRGAIIGISTISANIILCFTINKLPRNPKRLFIALSLVGVTSIILFLCIPYDFVMIPNIVFSIIIRFLSSFIYGMLLIWGVQVFPTVCRATGYSFILMGSCLGTILNYSFKNMQMVQLGLILLFSVVAIPVCMFLPETFEMVPVDEEYSKQFEQKDRFYVY